MLTNSQFNISYELVNGNTLAEVLETNALVHQITTNVKTSELAEPTNYLATTMPIFQGILINTGTARVSTSSYPQFEALATIQTV